MHPGRKPAHLAAAGKPHGRQAIWQAIRARRDCFSALALAEDTDIHVDTIRTYVQGLEAAGYIEKISIIENEQQARHAAISIVAAITGGQAKHPTRLFRLIKDVGIEAPRVTKDGRPVTQGAAREQMWRTMKMIRGDFSWRDLAINASTPEVPVAEDDAKDYCANLAKAGYLTVTAVGKGLGKAKAGGIPTRYRFNPGKNTGPRPPMVQRMATVFDPNLGKIVWHPEVES